MKYDENYILNLIDSKEEESNNLEFKSAGAFKKKDNEKMKIGRTISSFANSAGGVIIYGIDEEDHRAKEISFIDGRIFTKEWIEHVIESNLKRSIEKLEIIPIRFDDDLSKSVYIVVVPESFQAPHMSKDGKYYKRYEFEARPMEEYEVRQLYYRSQSGILEFINNLYPLLRSTTGGRNNPIQLNYELAIKIINVGIIPEEKFKLEIIAPIILENDFSQRFNILNYLVDENLCLRSYSIPAKTTIYPNEEFIITKFKVAIENSNIKDLKNIPLKLKLYYSGGIIEKEFMLLEKLSFYGKTITDVIF